MNVRRWAQAPSIGSVLVVLVAVSASSAAPTVPPPRFGRSVDIGLVSGLVIVTPVAGRSFRLGTQDRNIPVGSVIDTRRGEVDLRSSRAPGDASAAANAVAAVQDAQFSRGRFKILQRTSQRGLTVVDLITARNRHAVCATGSEASRTGKHLGTRVLGTLHARDNAGRFRTRGRYSAGTVRGTIWDTTDRCDGTLTVVSHGTVDVFDFRRRKTIAVHAGHSYLARALARRA